MPSTKITANDIPSVMASTLNCSERRQATPTARLNAPTPRTTGPERPERPRMRPLEPKIIGGGSRGSGLVSHSSNGQHNGRVLGVFFDLGPQTLDEAMHQTGIRGA